MVRWVLSDHPFRADTPHVSNQQGNVVRRSRYPLLAALAWSAAIGGLCVVLSSALWHDGLERVSGTWLALHYLAFMCQTFSYHAGLAMVPVVLVSALAKRKWLLLIAALVFAIAVGPELWTLRPRVHSKSSRQTLTLMSINLMYGKGDVSALLAQIERESPDLIVFQEWTPEGATSLRQSIARTFPHSVEEPRDDAFGQAVFSRHTFVEQPKVYPPLDGFHEPQITVAIEHDGKPMRVTNVHLLPPVSGSYFAQQRHGASELARWQADAARPDRPDVLAGDFNATFFSGIISTILSAGMRDAQRESGWWRGSTWPRVGALAYMPGLQLDHVLLGSRVHCEEAHVGGDFGSDHRPVIVRLGWR